jgi:hypothetical protein
MSPKGQNLPPKKTMHCFIIQLWPKNKKKEKKKRHFLGSFFYFRVFWGYLSFPKNREILPEHSFLFFKIKEVFPQKNGEN